MHDITAIAAAKPGATRSPNFVKNQRWYPTIYDLRRGAKWRLPHFAYEYGDGGAGDDTGIRHNWSALDSIEIIPRYGVMPELPPVNCELFGRKYTAPIGVAPMGSPIVVWPGADKLLATAAQRAKVPYTLGVAGGATIEEIAQLAPDVLWLQMYRFAKNDHAIGFDLMRRADEAGVHVLMLTLDVPVRTVRSREVKVGMGGGGYFRPDWRMMLGMVKCPGWAMAMLANNLPRFANIQPYAGPGAGLNDTIKFAREQMGGAFSWDEVKRYRDRWKRPAGAQGPSASRGRGEGGGARRRRYRRLQSRRPPDRGAAGADRLRAGHRQGGEQAGDHHLQFRCPQRHRCCPCAGARRRRGLCRQGVPVGSRRARLRTGRGTSSTC